MNCYWVWRLGLFLVLPMGLAATVPAGGPDFNRAVRPILARYCFKCHGPDDKARKAKLRLDVREEALKTREGGKVPIAPGKPDQSELVARIFNPDSDEVMPPPATKTALSPEQKQILKRWIAAGAVYEPHWAFVKPKQALLPAVQHAHWPRNPIDYFVLARLEAEGLAPSPPADAYTLVRRVYLDLVGFPPTPAEADAFVLDSSPEAYERLVDRLLASPQYGERWARKWLDLARYADTNGYEKDRPRSIWPWRDWVIKALNADLPFDEFTIEQIAGDMLPHATPDQIIATGFHRNTMLNEEGGIDPLEFRFHAVTDRMATTGKTWLGLTVQCAQCHTHKFDPIPHREYYQMRAFLNNADEPEYEVRPADYPQRAAEINARIACLEADLANQFPLEDIRWETPAEQTVSAEGGQKPERLPDGSWRFAAPSADKDDYVVQLDTDLVGVEFIRLEVLPDDRLPRRGPGRSESGNFVLTELKVIAGAKDAQDHERPIKVVQARADFSQSGFDVARAVDGDPNTGWAIAHPGKKADIKRTATFTLERPLGDPAGQHLILRLEQQYGQRHTIGRFRLSVGARQEDDRPKAVRRQEALDRAFAAWLQRQSATAVHWEILRPAEARSNLPHLSVQADNSVLATGDQSKSDTYYLKFHTALRRLTAIRLEALPDDRFPRHGPGRAYYEGPPGDFNLSDFRLFVAGKRVAISKASQSYAANGFPANNAIDDNQQTGWAIDGGQGRPHSAVFNLSQPLADASEFEIQLHFERHFCADLGRFRLSGTTDAGRVTAHQLPAELEELVLIPAAERTAAQRRQLLQYFLSATPELAAARAKIKAVRQQLTGFPTTLVMAERPPENPRPTFIHNRGEFLQPNIRVEPAVLSILNPLPPGAPRNRLGFARWLVSPDNPLTARVTVNRQWAAFFGRGIVRTVDDFGYQGDPPSHPALLDWLAVEFMKQGWSLKKLHRLIVLSATYRQASRLTPQLLARDPDNVLLARGPRVRLEAEMIRDSILRAAGLLVTNVGGPSVFPPQPASVTTDGAYGPLTWKVSQGPDRYRRGLYTFSKRTAPYAMFNTFDAPSGETCLAQREVSDTPLQALTMLNDTVILEAAQALGRTFAAQTGDVDTRIVRLFRTCLTRPPQPDETALLVNYFNTQEQRLARGQLPAEILAGKADVRPSPGAATARQGVATNRKASLSSKPTVAKDGGATDQAWDERAAWTLLARSLLNLDETVTKD